MNITLTITGGTAAEIQQAVTELSNSFAIDVKGELQSLKVKKTVESTSPKKAEEKETPPVVSTPVAENNDVTLEQVRATVQAKAQGGKREEVKKLLTEFGAENVTSLPKDMYADFLTKVNAL